LSQDQHEQLKAKPGDRGVEIGTRRVSSWKAGCTCALNLHARIQVLICLNVCDRRRLYV